jgi:hypothetical protein
MLAHPARQWSLFTLAALLAFADQSAFAQSCTLEYRRADNMWAPAGQPSPSLGVESVIVAKGQARSLLTDWKFEKLRNDGTTYYGSHFRLATNRGTTPVRIYSALLKQSSSDDAYSKQSQAYYVVQPGETKTLRDDIYSIGCL